MLEVDRHIDVWTNCLRIIRNILDEQPFNTWFAPIKPVAFQDNTLTVEVPSHFFREYLESAYLDVIKMTLKRVIGSDARLIYNIRPVQSQPVMSIPGEQSATPTNKEMLVETNPAGNSVSPFVYPGLHRIKVDPRLNPVYNFTNLVEGECNKMGITAGKNISLAPGKTPFNPLFVCGGPGVSLWRPCACATTLPIFLHSTTEWTF